MSCRPYKNLTNAALLDLIERLYGRRVSLEFCGGIYRYGGRQELAEVNREYAAARKEQAYRQSPNTLTQKPMAAE